MSSRERKEAGGRLRPSVTAGYSGTPLVRKLGIAAGHTVALVGEPSGFRDLLAPLPERVAFVSRHAPTVDITHLFAVRRTELVRRVDEIRSRMRDDAVLWVSWPKKSSGVESDITEDVIRQVALPLGLVDVKVCAVDATWSGLKLVVRRGLRRRV
jgi:hypothetical protein